MEALISKWKRRAKLFHEAYKDKSFEASALYIQKLQLEAYGADKVLPMQNARLRQSLLETARERNELRRQRTEIDEAIEIILQAMRDVEAEHSKTWYLPYLKLRNTFHHLVDRKYGLEAERN